MKNNTAKQKEVDDEHSRTGLGVEALKRAITDHLFYQQGRYPDVATVNDWYLALAYSVRDRLVRRWISTAQTYKKQGSRTVCYLSAEFLLGPQLCNNVTNLGIRDEVRQALRELGLDIEELLEDEPEPGLGNGGLGRLAACYMDSLASLEIPAIGYGIRYEFGIFDQTIRDGWQVEKTDNWLRHGNPWELPRRKLTFDVKLGGHTEQFTDDVDGRSRVRWIPDRIVQGIAYDTPILGYGVNTVNLLRLWKAEAPESFDFQAFNLGDYYAAVDKKVVSENITKVLYPNDEPVAGKQLRLQQQYFFVCCSLQDMLRIYLQKGEGLDRFHLKYAAQLNDTHPALAVPELMRLLIDEHRVDWDVAWHVTRHTFAYTNHTLLPEALERWPLSIFEEMLPRHLQIIYEINERFLDDARRRMYDMDVDISRLSIIEEGEEKHIRMAHLAFAGSFAVNGVAKLHTELLKQDVMRDFYRLWPERFSNKTNGVTPRRFLLLSNYGLSRLIRDQIGCDWITDLDQLKELEELAPNPQFQALWQQEKRNSKIALARLIKQRTGERVDPDSLFDIQAKRIHEYKRQHLNLLHIISLYNRLKHDPNADITPRTFIFAGKAAPGYRMAKLIIKLINSVAYMINRDSDLKDRLKVVFFPNFNVKNAQRIYPAADLSEQISTAGKEASGTGNMKFSLNGALTIGTLDGANIEIREEVGAENFFLFGLECKEIYRLQAEGYRPREYYQDILELRESIDLISSGFFSHGDTEMFRPLVDSLLTGDPYMLLADYQSYIDCQQSVSQAFRHPAEWTRMSILNLARMGKFSSDRSIREYCEEIWKVKPVSVEL
ncbi:MAG: glycogen/starch/alpha-glucan phosphorylase [Pseudomonadota bacterium]